MIAVESKSSRRIVGRLNQGDSVIPALLDVCLQHNISAGEIRGIGAVVNPVVSEWDRVGHHYIDPVRRDGFAEVLSLLGNVSLIEGQTILHLHLNASYIENGKVHPIAGHLIGAEVFALEFVIEAFDDLELVRVMDDATGLALWQKVSKKEGE